jgi:hypothetical protein
VEKKNSGVMEVLNQAEVKSLRLLKRGRTSWETL